MPTIAEQVDRLIRVAQTVILPRYGRTIRQLPGPVAQAMLAILAASESAGKRWVTTKPQGKKPPRFRKGGLTQRTTYEPGARGDCERDNLDPFDPLTNLWGAQRMFDRQKPATVKAVTDAGWRGPSAWDLYGLLYLCHSIGGSGTRKSIARAARAGLAATHDPLPAVAAWVDTADAAAAAAAGMFGVQSIALVRLRVHRTLQITDRAGEVGIGLPTSIAPCPPRPAAAKPRPRRLYARLDELARAAKAQGNAETGPW